MKLPIVTFKNTKKFRSIEKQFLNKDKRINLLNYFLLPNHNITSILTEKQNKLEILNQEYRTTQRFFSNINKLKEKNIMHFIRKLLLFLLKSSFINEIIFSYVV